MIYLVKTVICSAFFLAVYYLLLEKARMFRFNRAYLLLTAPAAFIVPLITFVTEMPLLPLFQKEAAVPEISSQYLIAEEVNPVRTDPVPIILVTAYFLVAGFLVVKFAVNIARLLLMANRGNTIRFADHRLVLLSRPVIPFSFLNYVFVSREEYEAGNIEAEVMHHELEHVRQQHSWDIVFIELVKAVAWFNPLLFLYRKVIQLNHEFLADTAVVDRFNDPFAYQVLLLDKIGRANHHYAVSSPFSYKITKKRLAMITHPFNRKANMVRGLAIIPAAAIAVFLFSEKITAQVAVEKTAEMKRAPVPASPGKVVSVSGDTTRKPPAAFPFYGGTEEGVPEELVREYEALAVKYLSFDSSGRRARMYLSDPEKEKMKEIFSKMSLQQQTKQDVAFLKPVKPYQKATPSEKLMNAFLDETKYGIWIDLKRAPNASLRNYKNTDFSQATVSKLYGEAKKGRSYTHQVNLMTNKYFNESNARLLAEKEPRLVMVVKKKS